MAKFLYPTVDDLNIFITIIQNGNYSIGKYLPSVTKEWYTIVSDCIKYIEQTSHYEDGLTIHEIAARILYKIAKRHELGDGNKRSAVIGVYIFCLINDYFISSPIRLKQQAKRISSTKGRVNEDHMKKKVAQTLMLIMRKIPSSSLG